MKTLLLGIDGSPASRRAVDHCRVMYDPDEVKFVAVNVVPAIPDEVKDEIWEFETSAGSKHTYEMEADMMEHAEEIVRNTVSDLVDDGFSVEVENKLGHPGAEICHLAEAMDVDGIVVGRSGKGIVSEVVLGSVSHHVIHHADQPVIVVPAPNED